jgi:hypothetical protein
MDQYISHLEEQIQAYERGTSLCKPSDVFTFRKEIASNSLMKIPDTTQPVLPEFIEGFIEKQEIESQFGRIKQCDSKAQKREQKCSYSSIVKIKEIPMPQLKNVIHISSMPSGEVWADDELGNLVCSDLRGNLLQVIPANTSSPTTVCHTVTAAGDLLYIYTDRKATYRVSRNMNRTSKLISTCDWEPVAIYSSHNNEDILVGLSKDKEQKVTRYCKEGEKIQDIQKDHENRDLYQSIGYITENFNSDICASDGAAKKVVVVAKSGQYRFSYSGHPSQSEFSPLGICTDVLGLILVCNGGNLSFSNIHLLDQNGQFLNFLLTPQNPRDVCIDGQQNLWVGCQGNPTVTVYTFLKKTDE